MAAHGTRRSHPAELVPGTLRVISVRMDYWPGDAAAADALLKEPHRGYIARYALGRDYHKVMRSRLQKLADRIETAMGHFSYRVFTDSAPVLEKPLAQKAGLGWIGKHTTCSTATPVRGFSRRALHRPAAAHGYAGHRPLRHLPSLH